jgi:hypothetical protein
VCTINLGFSDTSAQIREPTKGICMQRQISLILLVFTTQLLSAHTPEPQASRLVASGIVFDPIQRQMLRDNYDVWLVRADTGQVDVSLTPSQLESLQAQGLQLSVNAKLSWDARMQARAAPGQINGIANFPCYRTVEESFQTLDALALAHPNLVSLQTIGDSYLQSVGTGGYPMRAIKIENAAVAGTKAPMMVIGAIHAREYATAESVVRFAEHLLAGYGTDADITWMVDHSRILLVPQANPDGRKRAETGISQRRNLRPATCATTPANSGVDLNRNSSFLWGVANGSSTSGCSDTYRGSAASCARWNRQLRRFSRISEGRACWTLRRLTAPGCLSLCIRIPSWYCFLGALWLMLRPTRPGWKRWAASLAITPAIKCASRPAACTLPVASLMISPMGKPAWRPLLLSWARVFSNPARAMSKTCGLSCAMRLVMA